MPAEEPNMRILFYILYILIARNLPVSGARYAFGAKRFRYWVCKHLFAKCGKNVNVERHADIGSGRFIEIGDNSGIGLRCVVGKATIGKNVMMGPDVVFIDRSHAFADPDEPLQNTGYVESGPIVVGDNAWIGTRAIILPARKIGKCAIIGAGAVVTKDVPDYAIVAGNPARLIRYRKDPENIETPQEDLDN